MKNLIKILFVFTLLLLSASAFSQQEKFKAIYIYNFTKYLEWSPSYKEGNFVIGIIGNSEISNHLEIVAQKMKVGNQPIVVKRYNSIEDIDKCHLLFISFDKSSELKSILEKMENKNTLVVTDKNGMGKQGSGINFYNDDGELKFEISKQNIEKAGLKISPALLILGKTI